MWITCKSKKWPIKYDNSLDDWISDGFAKCKNMSKVESDEYKKSVIDFAKSVVRVSSTIIRIKTLEILVSTTGDAVVRVYDFDSDVIHIYMMKSEIDDGGK